MIGIIGAAETGKRIEQDHDVALVFDEALGLFENHFSDLNVALGRLIEGGVDDFAFDGALHVRDFFRTLVDEQDDQGDFGVVGGYRVGDRLQHHGLAGTRWRDDQSALAFADGAEHIEDAAG